MGERTKFTTDLIAPRHRLDYWNAAVADSFAPLNVEDCSPKEFRGAFTASLVDGLLMSQTDFAPYTAIRAKAIMRSDQFDGYIASIPIRGFVGYSQNDMETTAKPGEITLYDFSKVFKLSMNRDPALPDKGGPGADFECLNVSIPRDVMERILGPASKAAGLTIGADLPTGPVISGFFRGLMERGHLFDPSTAARMTAIGVDLLAAGFAERLAHEPKQDMGGAALAYRAKVLIEDRLWDTGLDTAAIAAGLNLSARRLQEVFAEQELTVDGYLWERRLARACTHLRDPAFARVSIATVAYDVGFISPAHFARRFRHRFGMTPSEYRDRARLA